MKGFVILTGSSGGIGLALARALVDDAYVVHGLARSRPEALCGHENYVHHEIDLTDTVALSDLCSRLLRELPSVDVLINNAGVGCFAPHEELDVRSLQSMLRLNLEVPILLSKMFLRALKKSGGSIVNISSESAKKAAPHGCAYAASKAGLTHFSESLYAECRKSGVRVMVCHPDMTQSSFYDTQSFGCDDDPEAFLETESVAEAVLYALSTPSHVTVKCIDIAPKYNKIKRKTAGTGTASSTKENR